MEIVLDRELANRRIWPAINLQQSGTRKEELLLTPKALEKAYRIRRTFDGKAPVREMEELVAIMQKFPDNKSFIEAGSK
jgi:transcription termination factor Rho